MTKLLKFTSGCAINNRGHLCSTIVWTVIDG